MLIHSLSYQKPMPSSEPSQPHKVMAIGDFDGVHLGHREVIRRAVTDARKLQVPAAVMTFDPHPREVLGQAKYSLSLTPLKHKLKLFEELGVDIAYIVSFDETLMRVTPEQFVGQMLLPLGLDTVIVGFDFTFGHRGIGTPDSLVQLSKGAFAVEVIRPYQIDGRKVSSTAIRDALDCGDITEANKLLGRTYSIAGEVVHGDARGRTIGFPTANIQPESAYVLPANGVYAIRAEHEGNSFDGVMNIGVKPTFASGGVPVTTLEAHLFEFAREIYGSRLEVQLIAHLRAERKFGSVQELIEQIRRDADAAKAHLLSM
jgi:riboflavin kinase / FMN adenylyltransferase